MRTKVMRVGVISRDEYRKRTIAISRGEYKPKKDEPKIWFESVKSLSQVLSSENLELLRLIIQLKPRSLAELEQISARKKSNLSRTLKTLENYGVVELPKVRGRMIPKVKATDFRVEFGLNYSRPASGNWKSVATGTG
jgi:predicted transcriptional regulator